MKIARHQRSSRSAPPAEHADLRARLAEAEETLRAIQSGEVDAVDAMPEGGTLTLRTVTKPIAPGSGGTRDLREALAACCPPGQSKPTKA